MTPHKIIADIIRLRTDLHIARIVSALGFKELGAFILSEPIKTLERYANLMGSSIYNRYFLMSFFGLSEEDVKKIYKFIFSQDLNSLNDIYMIIYDMLWELAEVLSVTSR